MAKENPLIKLKQDIKNNTPERLYLFYGEETYLKDLYVQRLLTLVPDDSFSEFNKITMDGKTATLFDVSDALSSFPMMSDRKIILIKDSGIFKSPSADAKEFYQKTFADLPEDTVLIFNETEIDKRSVLYKAASKHGYAVEFKLLSESEVVEFIQRRATAMGKKIQKDSAQYLIDICGCELSVISNELLKLTNYCTEEITKNDIDTIASKSLQVQVFELCDLLMEGNTDRVLQMIEDFKTVKESPFKLLYILFGAFDKMLRAKLLTEDGASYTEAVSSLGVPPFVAKKYINGAKSFSKASLIFMTASAAEADLAIKQGAMDDWAAFEEYINKFLRYIKENSKK